MAVFEIREPIWKDESIGLDNDRIDEDNYIRILYKDRKGNKLFPGEFYIEGEKAITYPTQMVGRGRLLRIIPIKDLDRTESD